MEPAGAESLAVSAALAGGMTLEALPARAEGTIRSMVTPALRRERHAEETRDTL